VVIDETVQTSRCVPAHGRTILSLFPTQNTQAAVLYQILLHSYQVTGVQNAGSSQSEFSNILS